MGKQSPEVHNAYRRGQSRGHQEAVDKIVEWLRKHIAIQDQEELDPDALDALRDVTDRIEKREYRW